MTEEIIRALAAEMRSYIDTRIASLPAGAVGPVGPPGERGEKGDPGDAGPVIELATWDGLIAKYEATHAAPRPDTTMEVLAESLATLARRELPVPHVTVEGPTINVAQPEVNIAPPAVNVTVEAARAAPKTAVIRRADGSETSITVTEGER